MKLTITAIVTALFLSVSIASIAQPSWEFGIFAGSSGYMGDLNPVKPYQLSDPALGGFFKRNFDGYWSLKFALMHGKIRGNDEFSESAQLRYRNLSFFTPVTELSVQTEFNFFNYIPSSGKRRISPYLFAGLGFVSFTPKTIFQGEEYELSLQGTEGQDPTNPYKTIALSIPFGTGIKYNIGGKITLGAEAGYRTAYTDYLDDVSGVYAPPLPGIRQSLADRSSPSNLPGTQRGDFRKHDTYMFVGLTISYSIFSQKCPVAQ